MCIFFYILYFGVTPSFQSSVWLHGWPFIFLLLILKNNNNRLILCFLLFHSNFLLLFSLYIHII
ncbi:hypothetical protein CLU79DRAFT_782814 [Phycomyces nitens]|nr:hypothetical protein CLU79DRAFT_782814 [Phycomyces nitens]